MSYVYHVCMAAYRSQKRASDCLQWLLEAVMSCPVMQTKPKCSSALSRLL